MLRLADKLKQNPQVLRQINMIVRHTEESKAWMDRLHEDALNMDRMYALDKQYKLLHREVKKC